MNIDTRWDLPALLDRYNTEIDRLKSKLLNGVPWEDLAVLRQNITELAVAIHQSNKYEVTLESQPTEAIELM